MAHVKSRFNGSRFLIEIALLLLCPRLCTVGAVGEAWSSEIPAFPSSINLRAAVLTNTAPLAWYHDNFNVAGDTEPFSNFRGFQPDLLRHLIKIAKELDNVTLSFDLEEAPPFSYSAQFEKLALDCGVVSNDKTGHKTLSEEDCNQYDLVVGDYYGNPVRSMRATLTPPVATTAGATIQYVHRSRRAIATLEEAQTLKEPVCLLTESFFDVAALELYPDLNIMTCSTHDECIRFLKDESCALFVEDKLQLRHIMTKDASLQVTPESFNENYIVWPLSARLDPLLQQLVIRWMYQAKVTGVLDELDKKYFSINFCPLGKAGDNCDLPCSATHGVSDRYGKCQCESTRWTGDDCSIEVKEDKNLLPSTLKIISNIMIAINFLAVAICAVWLYWNRATAQVEVAQPLFLSLVLVGCLISTSTIFALAAEDEGALVLGEGDNNGLSYVQVGSPVCMAIPWLYSVGFSITFAALFAKIRRVYLLFKAAATMQRVTVTAKETVLIVGGVLLIDVLILTVWTVLDPLEWVRVSITVDKFGYPLSSEGYCRSDYFAIFGSVIAAFHFSIMALACYLCYRAREIPTQFSEGRYVTVAMISNLQIFVVAVPVLIILGTDPQTSFFVRSVIIWMNDFVVLTLIFGNLMYSVHSDRMSNGSSKVMIRRAMSTYQERRNRRQSMATLTSDPFGSAHNLSTRMSSRGSLLLQSGSNWGDSMSSGKFKAQNQDYTPCSSYTKPLCSAAVDKTIDNEDSKQSDDSFGDEPDLEKARSDASRQGDAGNVPICASESNTAILSPTGVDSAASDSPEGLSNATTISGLLHHDAALWTRVAAEIPDLSESTLSTDSMAQQEGSLLTGAGGSRSADPIVPPDDEKPGAFPIEGVVDLERVGLEASPPSSTCSHQRQTQFTQSTRLSVSVHPQAQEEMYFI